MYHHFFIHSSVIGLLGCLNVLTIVNSASVNTGIHMSFQFWFPQGICLGVGLVGHMVVLFVVVVVVVVVVFKESSYHLP